jgi:Family of unknown function (DUF5372)
VPINWTDFVPADPYLSVGRGRSRFRMEDLLALADLVTALATPERPPGSLQRVSEIPSLVSC